MTQSRQPHYGLETTYDGRVVNFVRGFRICAMNK
jgi:hypothetical protein